MKQIYMKDHVHRAVKFRSVMTGAPMNDIVDMAIRHYFKSIGEEIIDPVDVVDEAEIDGDER